MGTISVSLPSDGTGADVADYNTPITTIVSTLNGGLDNANIASAAAIAGNKLASGGVDSTQLATGVVVQKVVGAFSAVATGTTIIPNDDTIPQSTEGDQYMTLAITPKSATNTLLIEVDAMFAGSVVAMITGGLFQDSGTSAIAGTTITAFLTGAPSNMVFKYSMVSGTVLATTFKFRAGLASAGTLTFNGFAGARILGAIPKSFITITEIKV